MLSKMGWRSGQGLGSKGAGIVNPVKASKHTEFGKGFAHMQIKKVQVAFPCQLNACQPFSHFDNHIQYSFLLF